MNLLDNLTLAYETLADDPIEVSIQYGKSILQAVSPKPKAAQQTGQKVVPFTVHGRGVRRDAVYVRRSVLPVRRSLAGAV